MDPLFPIPYINKVTFNTNRKTAKSLLTELHESLDIDEDFEAWMTDGIAVDWTFDDRIKSDLIKAEVVAIPITLIILGGQIRDDASFNRIFEQLEPINVTWPALVFVLLVDYALTAGWYWIYIRWWAPNAAARRERRDDRPRTG